MALIFSWNEGIWKRCQGVSSNKHIVAFFVDDDYNYILEQRTPEAPNAQRRPS
jgi:hypothetical protein